MRVRVYRRRTDRLRGIWIWALAAFTLLPASAQSEESRKLSIARGPLATVLTELAKTSGIEISVPEALILGKVAGPIEGQMTIGAALAKALAGTNLEVVNTGSGSYAVKQPGDTAQPSVPKGDVPAVVVTDIAASPHQDEGFKAGNAGDTVRLGDAPIKEVPIAVSVVTTDVLTSQAPTSATSALNSLAGVIVAEPTNGISVAFTVRGFQSAGYTINGSRASDLINIPIEAIERLEVLKGPTSILSGASADGGLVNVVTKMPTSETVRELVTRIGPNGYKSSALDLGGPVGESQNLSYRIVASATNADVSEAGYFDPSRYYIAPALKWSDDTVTVTGNVSYSKQRLVNTRPWSFVTTSDPAIAVSTYPGIAVLNPDMHHDHEAFDAKSEQTVKLAPVLNGLDVTFNNTINYSRSATVGYTLGFLGAAPSDDQNYTIAYRDYVQDYMTVRPSLTLNAENEWAKSTLKTGYDYQMQGNSVKLAMQIPLDLQTFRFAVTNLRTGPIVPLFDPNSLTPPSIPLTAPAGNTSWDEGVYVIEKLDLFKRLHLMGSLRRDWNAVKVNDAEKSRVVGDSFMVGSTLDVTDEISPYVNYSNGFVPGQVISTIVVPPEGRTLKEAGVKVSLPDSRLSATASLYELMRTNASFPIFDTTGAVIGVGNADGLRTRGLELELQGEILPGWNIIASYSHMNAALVDKAVGGMPDATAGLPKNYASIWTTYSIPMEWVESITIGGGMRAVSTSYANRAASLYSLDGYAIADAMIAMKQDSWTVQLNVTNIFDKQALVPSFYADLMTHEAERSWLLTVTKNF